MLNHLDILPPSLVPAKAALRSCGDSNRIALRPFQESWCCNITGTEKLRLVLRGKAEWNVSPLPFVNPNQDDDIHDAYFHVRRVDGNHSEIFIQTLIRAHLILLEDVAETIFKISEAKLGMLDHAFRALLLWAAGINDRPIPGTITWRTRGNELHSMRRWIRGHQIFAAITQGLIAVVRELNQALLHQERESIAELVELAVILLRGSAASLEFTGDFPSEDYNRIIRPSMTPPLVPDSFSGLLSSDHRHLVVLLRGMKPALDQLHDQNAAQHQKLADAIREVYDSHKFVCNRLVGKMPSLLMASGSAKSGADQIEKFKTIRMKVFEIAENEVSKNQDAEAYRTKI